MVTKEEVESLRRDAELQNFGILFDYIDQLEAVREPLFANEVRRVMEERKQILIAQTLIHLKDSVLKDYWFNIDPNEAGLLLEYIDKLQAN